jgi:sugar phosphate permease
MLNLDTVTPRASGTQSTTQKTLSYRYVIFAVIALTYFFVYFHRTSLAVMASELAGAFNIAPTALGLFGSMYFYAYAIGQLPAGILADRWGARKTIAMFVLVAGIGAIVFGAAGSFSTALFGRFLVGFGMGFVYVPAMRILTDWFRKNEFATFSGILIAVGNIGSLASTAPLVLLMAAIGWRNSMTTVGIITMVITCLAYILIRNKPHEIGGSSIAEIQGIASADSASTTPGISESLRIIVSSYHFWAITLLFSTMYGTMMGFQGLWAGPYLSDVYGLTKTEAGKLLTMIPTGMILGCPLSGILSDKIIKSRKNVVLGGAILYTLTWIPLVCLIDSISTSFLTYLLFFYGVFGGFCVVMYAHLKEKMKSQIAGTAIGFLNVFVFAAGALFQQIMGAIIAKYPPVANVIPAAAFKASFIFCFVAVIIGTTVYATQKE